MSDRAGRWVTLQVGRFARSVSEVAGELGCDWHTVNDAVVAYGEALVEDPGRFSFVEALGLDETLMVRRGGPPAPRLLPPHRRWPAGPALGGRPPGPEGGGPLPAVPAWRAPTG